MTIKHQRQKVHDVANALLEENLNHDDFVNLLNTLANNRERDAAMLLAARAYARKNPGIYRGVKKFTLKTGEDSCKFGYSIPAIAMKLGGEDDIYFADNALVASVMITPPKSREGAEYQPGSIFLPRLPSTIIEQEDSRRRKWAKVWADPTGENVTRLKPTSDIWYDAEQGLLQYPYLLYINALRRSDAVKQHMEARLAAARNQRSQNADARRAADALAKAHRRMAKRQVRMQKILDTDTDIALQMGKDAAMAKCKRVARDPEHSCQPGGKNRAGYLDL